MLIYFWHGSIKYPIPILCPIIYALINYSLHKWKREFLIELELNFSSLQLQVLTKVKVSFLRMWVFVQKEMCSKEWNNFIEGISSYSKHVAYYNNVMKIMLSHCLLYFHNWQLRVWKLTESAIFKIKLKWNNIVYC